MNQLRILITDDEQPILDGLERALRDPAWDISFHASPKAALGFLANHPVDIILADLRMAELDGGPFLDQASRIQPGAVRILCSAPGEYKAAIKFAKVAHLFLNKPCAIPDMIALLRRIERLHALPVNSAMREKLTTLTAVPVFPAVFQRVVLVLRRPECSIHEVSDVIAQDLGITSKLLQLVNSAFFGLSRQVTRVHDAVSLLGIETIKALVLNFGIFSQFEKGRIDGQWLTRLNRHSLQVGMLANRIARRVTSEQQSIDEAFLAGVLHDLGQLVLMNNFPEVYKSIINEHERDPERGLCQLEEEYLGLHHCLVGAFLSGIWGLPVSVMNAAMFHHLPSDSPEPIDSVLLSVHVAEAMACARNPKKMDLDHLNLDLAFLVANQQLEVMPELIKLHSSLVTGGG